MADISFSENVYKSTRKIPKGKVSTYKYIGDSIGSRAYQAIGQALSRNPNAPTTPCHRVVKTDGTIGGFMGSNDSVLVDNKVQLLRSEGIQVKDGKIVNFEEVLVKKL